ncbi:MAG: EAL domain-containing protein [Methylococcaceae bacterium]
MFVVLTISYSGVLVRWDRALYDVYSRVLYHEPPEDIVIVAIDDESISHLGRWPWSRWLHAGLIERLTEAGVKGVAFDIVFAENSLEDPASDIAFADRIKKNAKVVLPIIYSLNKTNAKQRIITPTPKLSDAAAKLAQVEVEPDSDGLVRSVFLKSGIGNARWPTLGLALAEVGGIQINDLPGERNPWLQQALPENWVRDYKVLLPFAGPPGHIKRIPFYQVLNDDAVLASLKNKFILIGVTATALKNNIPTPVAGSSRAMTGAEFHATVLDTLLRGAAIKSLPFGWTVFLMALWIGLPLFCFSQEKPSQSLFSAALIALSAFMLSSLLLKLLNYWYSPLSPMLVVVLSFVLWSWFRLESLVKQLFNEKKRIEVTVSAIADGIISTDNKGRIEYLNPVAENLTGYRLEEARGMHLENIFNPVDSGSSKIVPFELNSGFDHLKLNSGQQRVIVNRFGTEFTIRTSFGVIKERTGRAEGLVLAISDVSETEKILSRMTYQASHDVLTRLPNRALLRDRLKHAIARAQRGDEKIAALFIDLDGFKKINDAFGHAGGDELIRRVAWRLGSCVRKKDTLARLGGDEFVIVLENIVNSGDVALIAQKILVALAHPFSLNEQNAYITSSIGISIYPRDGKKVETLLKNADTAMYRAKECGRNNFQFFEAAMNQRMVKRIKMEGDLRCAIEKRELELFYQPLVDMNSGRTIGLEALLRWKLEDGSCIAPDTFIPLAEESGLILPLGELVIEDACRQASQWQAHGIPPVQISINLSPKQFANQDVISILQRCISANKIAAKQIKLEITESMLMQDFDRAIEILESFRCMGGEIAIDDFGTGYSSLSYLQKIPVDQIKIDQSFVNELSYENDDSRAITKAIIDMAHGLRLGVVAEGVENQYQYDLLKKQHCNIVQGYFLGRPLGAMQTTALLKQKAQTNTLVAANEY